ncbi:MAG: hypothetical protein IIA62_06245 [Nitrospinae bacterium]|nr:hypothetical protein [Nitrospinota bacterium]
MHSTPIRPDCVDAGPRVAINEPPLPSSTLSQPSPQEYVCGPDVTEHVLRGLRKLYTKRWLFWDEEQRTNKCLELINPLTGASAWEINVFAPSRGMDSKEGYLKKNPTQDDEDYEKYTKFPHWLQSYSPDCAIPKGICGPTVTFLGQCIHSQVVNYVLWGFMNKLCGLEPVADFWHSLWSMGANVKTYHGQKVMSEVGAGIAEEYDSAVSEGRADGEFNERLNVLAKSKLESAMSNLDYYGFLLRHEDRCSLTCTLTPEMEEVLRQDSWNMQWGVGASGNRQ